MEELSDLRLLDKRSREIFETLVYSYFATGDPVGSRTLTRDLSENISAATVRNVMQDLEHLGILGSPHVSAGRIPTQLGLRLFVDGILEMKQDENEDYQKIEQAITQNMESNFPASSVFERTGGVLSTLSQAASFVFSKKIEAPIKHIEFVALSENRALVILVTEDGNVENRIFKPPYGMIPSELEKAGNLMNAYMRGKTLSELKTEFEKALNSEREHIETRVATLVESGALSLLNGQVLNEGQLLVRGRANLISENADEEEIAQIKTLLDDLETKKDIIELLGLADGAQPVRVFIGSENKLFSLTGSSLVISPYMNGDGRIIGAVGVIGPTRLNYARIVPMVSYTAQLVGKLIEGKE